jgi:predicted PurR-regulated permease PerM
MPLMDDAGLGADRFRKAFVLGLTAAISVAFVATIRPFLMALLLAAVLAGICRPLHRGITQLLRGRDGVAAIVTILLVVAVVVGPLSTFFGIVTNQALEVGHSLGPWVTERIAAERAGTGLLAKLPSVLLPYQGQILERIGGIAAELGRSVVDMLAAATRGTLRFLLFLVVTLYAGFFFLRDGGAIRERVLSYAPLSAEEKARMVERFVSVSRATFKGILLIGSLQGALGGIAFAVAGITAPAFWGTVMALCSMIPGVGTALVWIPTALVMLAQGRSGTALGIVLWFVLVVGTVDNFLRPRIVGKDTKLPDLLILISTLGGIFLFGAAGIVLGPLVAALFVTIWDIFGLEFRSQLMAHRLAAPPVSKP